MKIDSVEVVDGLSHHEIVKQFETLERHRTVKQKHANHMRHALRVAYIWPELTECDQQLPETFGKTMNLVE
jgi:hypothetical protein